MHSRLKRLAGTAVLTGFSLASFSAMAPSAAGADEQDPGVARISMLDGGVDVKRADSGDTVAAVVNAPLNAGDYLTTQDDAHAELQLDDLTELRVAPDTQLRFTTMTSDSNSLQLAQGTVELRLFRGNGAHPEIDAPNATVRPSGNGAFRVSVDNDGNAIVTVRSGEATVSTQNDSQTISRGASLAIDGNGGDARFASIDTVASDDFDDFNRDRDGHEADAASNAYVDDQIVGAGDLDRYGSWQNLDGYGEVWHPHYAADWAPYRDGSWSWQPYYGWTWVSAEPWGWAPYHYGRWFYAANDGGWCWTPATRYARPIYRPAQVAFFSFGFGDGGGISAGIGNVGWVPLGPTDPFHPWWGGNGYGGNGYGGRGYGGNTTIVDITNVTNIYNYRNINAPGGIVAVRNSNFRNGEFRQRLDVTPAQLRTARIDTVRGIVPIVPTTRNLAYNGAQPAAKRYPLRSTFERFKPVAAPATRSTFVEQRAAVSTVAQRAYPTEAKTFEREAPTVAQSASLHDVTREPNAGNPAAGAGSRTSVPVIRGEADSDARVFPVQQPAVQRTQSNSPWDRFAKPGSSAEGAVPKVIDVRATNGEASRGTRTEQTRPSYSRADPSQQHVTTTPNTATPQVETPSGNRSSSTSWDGFRQTTHASPNAPASTRATSDRTDDALTPKHGSVRPSYAAPQNTPAYHPQRSDESGTADTERATHRYSTSASPDSASRHVAQPSFGSNSPHSNEHTAPATHAVHPTGNSAPPEQAAPSEHHDASGDHSDSHHAHE